MSIEVVDQTQTQSEVKPNMAPYPRVWPAVLAVVAFWAFYFVGGKFGLPLNTLFFSRLGACAAAILFGTLWWWTCFRIPLRDRALIAAIFVIGTAAAAYLSDKSVGGFGMYLFGIPVAFSAGAVALLIARRMAAQSRRTLVLTAIVLAFVGMSLVRMEGVRGNADSDFTWRWAPTAEDRFLAERETTTEATPSAAVEPLVALPGDWTEFRGPQRDGVVTIGEFRDDWQDKPPQLIWKKRVGPAWSAVIVVAGRLFTQEQRGEQEAVVCYDAETGAELWSHEETSRYWDAVAGAGPRATPTFHDGRIYAFGAEGILVCLEAATGDLVWKYNTLEDKKQQQMWGFASSPLTVGKLVVVYGGGQQSPGSETKTDALVAVNIDTGEKVWSADGGQISYVSAQHSEIGGQKVLLFSSDLGVQAFEPESGKLLWSWGDKRQETHSVQPRIVRSESAGERLFAVTSAGFAEGKVKSGDEAPTIDNGWLSKHLKPDFNDYVVYQEHAYGFDGEIFACVSLKDGKRAWKQGRYGHGQVILLANKAQLLVLGEKGELVLLAANPKKHEELGKFQAIEGKTWNHPTVAHGRVYVRNAEEMACYEAR